MRLHSSSGGRHALLDNACYFWNVSQEITESAPLDDFEKIRCHYTPLAAAKASSIIADSEERYRRLFETATDGILMLDAATGLITDANPALYELLGYSTGALLGKQLWELGLFKDREANKAAFQRLLEVGHIRYDDLPLQTQRGESREVKFVSTVYQENGHDVVQCNIRDITERKRIERALQASLVRERRITKALQHSLTTEVAEEAFPGLLIAAHYEPALEEAEVGGDFFDAFAIRSDSEGRCLIALAVGDVTGKGLHAAVLAGRVKEVLRAFLHEDPEPARTLIRLNDYLCDSVSEGGGHDNEDANLLVALSLAVIDTGAGTVSFSSAGAELPALLRVDGSVEVIDAGGILLGIQLDETYPKVTRSFEPGDAVLLVTDGITEARRGRDLLEYDGMIRLMKEFHAGASVMPSVRATGQAIVEGARAFGDGFRDDVCLLLARRR